ncbi:MAG: hypothetical protein A2096_06395 [Spirochaetes bacterium GWF1_41_5]|nr:MAG: hypothetical protein A2096_06395 [Spirochaetes bacterium GWF1_41_5]HBE01499.1 sugar isomerase [Spirochaetia bacterium]
MNRQEEKYGKYALMREMLETVEVIRKFPIDEVKKIASSVKNKKILLTGEGSSRIFPAKKIIYDALKNNYRQAFFTEGANQACEYNLDNFSVCIASNSGKTKECVRLMTQLKKQGHKNIIGVTANSGTPVASDSNLAHVLACGKEDAVAATKSVIATALFYDVLFRILNKAELPDPARLAGLIETALTMPVKNEITGRIADSPRLFYAGRNNGVAEEITLKTNEITRKKSAFLEGTYAVHGIEEVMHKDETVIVFDPFLHEEEKFEEVLVKGVGMTVLSVSSTASRFPGLKIPEYGDFSPYIQLAAGWNLLVEAGLALNINLDKPERARKVGNEFIAGK